MLWFLSWHCIDVLLIGFVSGGSPLANLDHPRRYADDRAVIRHVVHDDSIGANVGAVTDPYWANDLAAGTKTNGIAHLFYAPVDNHPGLYQAVSTDLSWSKKNAGPGMNDQPWTYVRRLWDVHPGETANKPTERHMNEQQEVPQHRDPELPRPVSKAVYEHGLRARIQELGEYATTVHDAGAPDICSNVVKHARSCSQLVFGSRSAQSASVKLCYQRLRKQPRRNPIVVTLFIPGSIRDPPSLTIPKQLQTVDSTAQDRSGVGRPGTGLTLANS